ncbi:hypothetical protein OJAV_G00164740 [Oryzias javanicus]|uniref:Homocysteine-responsive endoplasmic reticulum-resident ubiquitin-like domain member 2 protein n=1 Tax=Oryzias javanicus TaxID=123683 RepID=A0A437CL55_ORYJA|nr:hypothetical protein OJAV_G00164740 [Oryzias javanicus]
MDSGGVDSPVTLIIKAPNQKYEDQTINCFLNWTVERLKSHISKVYPSRPLSRDQRLVYSGRLLQDHLQLGDVLRKQDEYHMMHLVCASHSPPASPVPRTPSSDSSSSDDSPSPENPPASPSSSSSSSVPGGSDGLRFRFPPYAQWPAAAQVPLNGGLPPHVPFHPAYMPLQMLWWQQMYARHYYLQYHAAAASAQPAAPPAPAPSPSPLPPAQPNEPVQPLGPAHNPLPEDQPANPIQMNAQGGPVLNEDELNRDWLDWLYTVSRASVLLSIVYFYSSFSRFVMVAGAMLLVYLYQAGWAIFRPEQQNFGGVDRAGAPPGEAERRQDLQEMERLMDDGMEDEDSAEEGGGGPEDLARAAARPEPSLLTTAWSFISTFFTSLLPERPPHLAN